MSQIQEWSGVTTYESASPLRSVFTPQDPTEHRNVHVPSGSSVSTTPFTVISGEYPSPILSNSSPIKISSNAPSPTVSVGRRRHASSRSSSIHRSTSSLSRRPSESRRIEGGINKNRSSTIASPKARVATPAAIDTYNIQASREVKKQLSTTDPEIPSISDPSPEPASGKRRALLNRLSTRFSTFNKPLNTSPSEVHEGGTPYNAMKSGEDGGDHVLSSFLPLSKDPLSSPFFPSRPSWAATQVPGISPKPKPPPLTLQSSNLIFSSPKSSPRSSLRPPPSPSRNSLLLSPSTPLFAMPQPSASALLSPSSASSSAGSPPSSATSRWARNRSKVGPPLTPPPNYPLPSLPPSPSEASKAGLSQDDIPWQFQERSSRRDSFLNLADSPTDHDDDKPKWEAEGAERAPLVPHKVESQGVPAYSGDYSLVSPKLDDGSPAATDHRGGSKALAISIASASSEEYLTPPEHRHSLPDDGLALHALDGPSVQGTIQSVLAGHDKSSHDVSPTPQSQSLSSLLSHTQAPVISPAENNHCGGVVPVIRMTEVNEESTPQPIQIVFSTDVSSVPGLDLRSRAECPTNCDGSVALRVQHLEATQPDQPSDHQDRLDPHGSKRGKQLSQQERVAPTMSQQLQHFVALPLISSSASTSSTTLPLSLKLHRVRTKDPLFYFYESSGSESDGSDCGEEPPLGNDPVAVLNRKRHRGETHGSPRRLVYTTPRKHATRLTSKGTLRAVPLASGTSAGGPNNKPRVSVRGPNTPQSSPTSLAPLTVPTHTIDRNAGSLSYSPTTARHEQQSPKIPSPTATKATLPTQHERTGSGASSGSASGPHVAVRRSNMVSVVMPRPAERRSASTSSSVLPSSKPTLSTNSPTTTTAASAVLTRQSHEQAVPSSPISLRRPGSQVLRRSEEFPSPSSSVGDPTVRLPPGGGGSSNVKPLENPQIVAQATTQQPADGLSKSFQPASEGGKTAALPAAPPAEGRLRALFKRKSKSALMHLQHTPESSSVERPKLPELPQIPQDFSLGFSRPPSHPNSDAHLTPSTGRRSFFGTIRGSKISLGSSSATSATSPIAGNMTTTTAPPSPAGPPPLPEKESYSPSTHSRSITGSSAPPSPVILTTGWQQQQERDTASSSKTGVGGISQHHEAPSIPRRRRDTDSSWASVSVSPAGDGLSPSFAPAAVLNQATPHTFSELAALEDECAPEEEDQTETQGENGLPSSPPPRKLSQSRFATTANIFSKVKQRAKSLARPEPVHLESAPTTPGMERASGGATLPPLPAFLFDPQAEGTSSHAQVLAYGQGAASYGRSKSDVLPIPSSVFRPTNTASGTSNTGGRANTNGAAGAGSSSSRPSREYSSHSYTDPRVIGSARLQEALERDVPANASTITNNVTKPRSGEHKARASLAELQWSQMLYDS